MPVKSVVNGSGYQKMSLRLHVRYVARASMPARYDPAAPERSEQEAPCLTSRFTLYDGLTLATHHHHVFLFNRSNYILLRCARMFTSNEQVLYPFAVTTL
jgi:hypothetical protein